jgi:hypothetical protein
MAHDPRSREPGAEPVVREERVVERRGFLRRVIGAIFATAVGVLAFIGLLVVAAIVLVFVLL